VLQAPKIQTPASTFAGVDSTVWKPG